MMRRHHENRILFDFPGMESKASLFLELEPSPPTVRSRAPFFIDESFEIDKGSIRISFV